MFVVRDGVVLACLCISSIASHADRQRGGHCECVDGSYVGAGGGLAVLAFIHKGQWRDTDVDVVKIYS